VVGQGFRALIKPRELGRHPRRRPRGTALTDPRPRAPRQS
jgi:hypothetical protein